MPKDTQTTAVTPKARLLNVICVDRVWCAMARRIATVSTATRRELPDGMVYPAENKRRCKYAWRRSTAPYVCVAYAFFSIRGHRVGNLQEANFTYVL